MTFNLPLAVKVLAVIEESEQWDDWHGPRWGQGSWGWISQPASAPVDHNGRRLDAVVDVLGNLIGWGSCGTSMCFAGWALSFEKIGLQWYGDNHSMYLSSTSDGREPAEAGAAVLGIEWTPHPQECDCFDSEDCPHEERYPLWDSSEDMPRLFSGTNDKDTLYQIVAEHADMDVSVLREMVQEQMIADRKEGLTEGKVANPS